MTAFLAAALISAAAASGPAAVVLAGVLYLLVPPLVYLACPDPHNPPDPAQRLFARCTAAALRRRPRP